MPTPPPSPPWILKALALTAGSLTLLGLGTCILASGWPLRALGLLGALQGATLLPAFRDPFRHWPALAQAALTWAALAGVFGLAWAAGDLPAALALSGLLAGLLGAFTFLGALKQAWSHAAALAEADRKPLRLALEEAITHRGEDLSSLSHRSPLLIVFLRQFGCTFCREAAAELARLRPSLEAHGTRLVLVHMGTEEEAEAFFTAYGLQDVDRVGDRVRWLYRAFGLRQGSLWQLLGPRIWWRGLKAGLIHGHGMTRLEGDAFQMPGVFLVHHDEMLRSHLHRDAADRPDYGQLAICPARPKEA